jgi:crotonobetainyl-CoA:carnitine CoA-transferase CaiB-like acyl-CoA transferase
MEEPNVKRRGLSIVREHLGLGTIRKTGPSGRLSRTPVSPGRAVPAAGLDTADVLEDIGMGERVGDLIVADVIYLG